MASAARDRIGHEVIAERPRILVVAPFPPRLDGVHGGSRAVAQRLDRLAERHDVALLVLRDRAEPGVDERLRGRCDLVEEVEVPAVGPSLGARLANRIRLRTALVRGTPTWAAERMSPAFAARLEELAELWRPDVVQLELRIMGQFLPALEACPARRILVDHDPGSDENRRSVGVFGPFETRAWRRLARTISRYVDAIVVFTDRDRKTVASLNPSARTVRISLGYEVPERPLDPGGSDASGIVYVGSFVHPPNIDAATRLARDIFPRIRRRLPDASLHLVGSFPPKSIRALHGAGVVVTREVPDVRPYLDAAAVVAAPIRTGGGMRVKVLEALASGKALVASPLAIDGLDLIDGDQIVVAETDDEFVEALLALLLDSKRRTEVALAARRWAELHLGVDSQVHAYETLYASLLEDRPRSARRLTSVHG